MPNRSRYIRRVRSINHRKHAFDRWLLGQLSEALRRDWEEFEARIYGDMTGEPLGFVNTGYDVSAYEFPVPARPTEEEYDYLPRLERLPDAQIVVPCKRVVPMPPPVTSCDGG